MFNNLKGSIWRRWDLHVHTPCSIVQEYGGDTPQAWESFIADLENLPRDVTVIGINDYLFLDGYKKVLEYKTAGRLANIELILPVVEFRLKEFVGNEKLRRLNFHILFADVTLLSPAQIEAQFLSRLSGAASLSSEVTAVTWAGVVTRESLIDLGKQIRQTTPAAQQSTLTASDIQLGFNNINFELSKIEEFLGEKGQPNTYLHGKYFKGIGKAEWEDFRWTGSIADKKSIINKCDFIFCASGSAEQAMLSRKKLIEQGVNNRLLHCSDAHFLSTSGSPDRKIGLCFAWIKGDPTFEGLRQALLEFDSRVHVGDTNPIEPLLTIKRIDFDFPEDSKLGTDSFCFRGKRTVNFSPNLTCVIGGRGTGKSTLLNLLHEKLYPGKNRFFGENHPTSGARQVNISTAVKVDGDTEQKVIEFLSQNEVVEFALNHERFTGAIFSRLAKLDSASDLAKHSEKLRGVLSDLAEQIKRVRSHANLKQQVEVKRKELQTNKNLISSLENDEYKNINAGLAEKTRELQALESGKKSVDEVIGKFERILEGRATVSPAKQNAYETFVEGIFIKLREFVAEAKKQDKFTDAVAAKAKLENEVGELRKQLDEFLKKQGLSNENLLDVSRAAKRIAELDDQIRTDDIQLASSAVKIRAFSFDAKSKTDHEKTINDQLAPVNEVLKSLSDEVKSIELQYVFNADAAKEALVQEILGMLPKDEATKSVRPDYLAALLFQVPPNEVEDRKHEEFIALLENDKQQRKTGEILARFFRDETNFDIYKLLIKKTFSDVDAFKQILVLYDGKPLQNSSFGQRCTAAIVVLLLLGNNPIIIDEPEAHLDSSLIANYLVELVKKSKRQRQIIFATHNANFVINGDAELVHVLTMDSTHQSVVTPTTIENLQHRKKLLALEGGEEAFLQRERRYHFQKP